MATSYGRRAINALARRAKVRTDHLCKASLHILCGRSRSAPPRSLWALKEIAGFPAAERADAALDKQRREAHKSLLGNLLAPPAPRPRGS